MVKGLITDNLYVRNNYASQEGWAKFYFQEGDEVTIEKAVYGQKIEENDLWYKLDSGKFIWSGCVKIIDGNIAPPTEKRVIFTADDYGVVESINEGVKEAVRRGILRSVSCFTNYGEKGEKSLRMIRELQEVARVKGCDVELGVHLTITSGSPLIGRQAASLLCRDDKSLRKAERKFKKGSGAPNDLACLFYAERDIVGLYQSFANDAALRNTYLNQLREELKAQMNVFLRAKNAAGEPNPIPIGHLTSHHNSVFFHADLFDVVVELAYANWLSTEEKTILTQERGMQFPIPIRSLVNVPSWKEWLYMRGRVRHKGEKGWEGPLKFLQTLQANFCSPTLPAGKVKTPGFLNSAHYGPLPAQSNYGTHYNSLVSKKQKKALDMLNELRWGDTNSMEFLLHIRSGGVYSDEDIYFENEVKPTGYDGIDSKAFDSRRAELQSFMLSFKTEADLPHGVFLGSWKTLGNNESCKGSKGKAPAPNLPNQNQFNNWEA